MAPQLASCRTQIGPERTRDGEAGQGLRGAREGYSELETVRGEYSELQTVKQGTDC